MRYKKSRKRITNETEKYYRATSYAFKCNPFLAKDLVHTAYLLNHNKDGTNLFTKDIYFILACVKNAWFNYIRSSRFTKNGESRQWQWYPVGEEEGEVPLASTSPSPADILIGKEVMENFTLNLDTYPGAVANEDLRLHANLLLSGYKQVEIASQMGLCSRVVNYRTKIIRSFYENEN